MKQMIAILASILIAGSTFASDKGTRTGVAIKAAAFAPAQIELLKTFTGFAVEALAYEVSPLEFISVDTNGVPNGVHYDGTLIWRKYYCSEADNPIRDYWVGQGVTVPTGYWYVMNRYQTEVGKVGADAQLIPERRGAMKAWMAANPSVQANVRWVTGKDVDRVLLNMTGMVPVPGEIE